MSPLEQQPSEHPENIPYSGEASDVRADLSAIITELEQKNLNDRDRLTKLSEIAGVDRPGILYAVGSLEGREVVISILKAHLAMSGPEADAHIRKMMSQESGE